MHRIKVRTFLIYPFDVTVFQLSSCIIIREGDWLNILYYFSLALQREQYLREKKEGSDAYRKALDAQV